MTCTLKPLGNTSHTFIIDAIVLSKICTYQPSTNIDFKNWSHIKKLKLADLHFYKPGSIDLLLGAEIFSQILQDGRIAVQSNQPIGLNTQYGWILMGTFTNSSHLPTNLTLCNNNSSTNMNFSSLETILKRFWEIEEIRPLYCSITI